MNNNPDTLREWAKNHTHLFEDEEEFLVASADAWEAEREENRIIFEDSTEVVRSLRKRLEAAEKWRRVAAMLRSAVKSGEPWTATLEAEWDAALAAEEEKPDGWILSDGHRAGHG